MKTAFELADAIDNSEETTGFERRCASMLRTLSQENEALKADAERYRWLRALPIEAPQIGLDVVMWSKDDESVNSGIGIRLAGLDAAIDSMKGKS